MAMWEMRNIPLWADFDEALLNVIKEIFWGEIDDIDELMDILNNFKWFTDWIMAFKIMNQSSSIELSARNLSLNRNDFMAWGEKLLHLMIEYKKWNLRWSKFEKFFEYMSKFEKSVIMKTKIQNFDLKKLWKKYINRAVSFLIYNKKDFDRDYQGWDNWDLSRFIGDFYRISENPLKVCDKN